MPFRIAKFEYAAAGAATPLHDNTNSPANPPRYVHSFLISPTSTATVYIGEAGVTGASDGVEVDQYCNLTADAPLSRGESNLYDLTKIYYIGGAFSLAIDKEGKP